MSTELGPFATAGTLTWVQYAVFAPGQGLDGSLLTDTGMSLPLDVYTPAEERDMCRRIWGLSCGTRIVRDGCGTLDGVRDAVRAWCRDQLGRGDIQFSDMDLRMLPANEEASG